MQTVAPPASQTMSMSPPEGAGLGWLATIDGLYVARVYPRAFLES